MSIHSDCGANIKWARRTDDNDRFMPPLEFAGFYYIIDESGNAIEVTTYKMHECQAEQVVSFQKNKRAAAEAKGVTLDELTGYDIYQVQREEERKKTWKIALKVECETCHYPAGHKCRSLAKGPNFDKITKNPHPKRVEQGMIKANIESEK